jgi:hypothetical protein
MTMKCFKLMAGIAAATLVGASCANAAGGSAVTLVFQGVVASGFDTTGVFGGANTVLDGMAYTETFSFGDFNGPGFFNPPLSSELHGGPFADGVTSITINGHTRSFGCLPDGCLIDTLRSAGANGQWGVNASMSTPGIDAPPGPGATFGIEEDRAGASIFSATDQFVTNFDYRRSLFHLVQPDDIVSGSFAIDKERLSFCPPCGPPVFLEFASANLTPLSVSVFVPEPATWLSMILGFGLVGAVMRRRAVRTADARL